MNTAWWDAVHGNPVWTHNSRQSLGPNMHSTIWWHARVQCNRLIAAGDVQAINYFVAQKYTETLKAIGEGNNTKIVFMPLETSSLLGSIGGIGELAKEAFGKDK